MQLVLPSVELLDISTSSTRKIEKAARTCYQSEGKIGKNSDKKLVRKLMELNHGAMLEFADMTLRFVVDRGVSHELVRHRLVSFAQESTRYCKYGNGVTFIIPCWVNLPAGEYNWEQGEWCRAEGPIPGMTLNESEWLHAMWRAQESYLELINRAGDAWSAQQARSVLPNSLKTQICMKANLREWIHIFKERTSPKAHPQMREVMEMAVMIAAQKVPMLFNQFICK
jgi:thymidylate synthase (FAD)